MCLDLSWQLRGEALAFFGDLGGELAGRGENEDCNMTLSDRWTSEEGLQRRKEEGSGFAGPCFSLDEAIVFEIS